MAHRLDPLLRPRSIAVVGATPREGAVGNYALANLREGGYPGALFAVNPRYDEVCGLRCFASLDALPEPVEHVVFGVGDVRIEQALDAAIEHGAQAATIMSSLVLAGDREPPLRERIRAKAEAAGLLVCGGNGMGFYNFRDRVRACGFDTRRHERPGNVSLISHSGSGMCGIVDVEERLDFNLAVSTGQELTVAMDEYLDFALDLPETRVVGLFMETVRNPAGLIAAFDEAAARGIPIVALKVGRTALAARLTVSHSGALAGADAAFDAVFARYGVHRVRDMDELATALIMFAQPHSVASGGLVSVHDSGGERQLAIDLADEQGVRFAGLSSVTTRRLAQLLDPGLPAVNPLDAWSAGGPDAHRIVADSLAAMMSDKHAAIGAVIHDRAPGGAIYASYAEYLRRAHAASGKPVFLVSNRQGAGSDPLVLALTREGFPVLDGLRPFLVGARCLLAHRDFQARRPMAPPLIPAATLSRCGARVRGRNMLGEGEGLALLADLGLDVVACELAASLDEATRAADELGYPVALKTAEGLAHKSDAGGVRLGLEDRVSVAAAYRDVVSRLGPRVLVARMAPAGVEMMLGVTRDAQFGPLVVIGAGGIHAEVLQDAVTLLPPFDAEDARRAVSTLKLRALLDGVRGAPPADLDSFCTAAARMSAIAAAAADWIDEIDVNPVIVAPAGCVAVDCLIVPRKRPADAAKTRRSIS